MPEAGVASPGGKRLHPGAVQPHRPQHRRHRDRRQDGGSAAGAEPEDQGPGDSTSAISPSWRARPSPKEGEPERVSLQGRRRKTGCTSRTRRSPAARPAETQLQDPLQSAAGLSLVECELITGRTHQIRAQFAHAGTPPAGRRQVRQAGQALRPELSGAVFLSS